MVKKKTDSKKKKTLKDKVIDKSKEVKDSSKKWIEKETAFVEDVLDDFDFEGETKLDIN